MEPAAWAVNMVAEVVEVDLAGLEDILNPESAAPLRDEVAYWPPTAAAQAPSKIRGIGVPLPLWLVFGLGRDCPAWPARALEGQGRPGCRPRGDVPPSPAGR